MKFKIFLLLVYFIGAEITDNYEFTTTFATTPYASQSTLSTLFSLTSSKQFTGTTSMSTTMTTGTTGTMSLKDKIDAMDFESFKSFFVETFLDPEDWLTVEWENLNLFLNRFYREVTTEVYSSLSASLLDSVLLESATAPTYLQDIYEFPRLLEENIEDEINERSKFCPSRDFLDFKSEAEQSLENRDLESRNLYLHHVYTHFTHVYTFTEIVFPLIRKSLFLQFAKKNQV